MINRKKMKKTPKMTFKSKHFYIERLVKGVYAAIASDEGTAICNAGIIDVGEFVVIFDTFLTPNAALDLKKVAMQLTDKPIKFLINSHYHNDHIRGNQVFYPSANIIASKKCQELIETKGIEEINWDNENAEKQLKALEKQIREETNSIKRKELEIWVIYYRGIIESLSELKIILPNLCFGKKLTIRGEQRTLEVINTEESHTESDSILYVREDQILFTGDLVFVQCHPVLVDGNPDKWLSTLEYLKTFKIKTLIPGHGPIGTKKDINLLSQYIITLKKIAKEYMKVEKQYKDRIINEIPPPFDMWRFGNFFFNVNLQFLLELHKENSS